MFVNIQRLLAATAALNVKKKGRMVMQLREYAVDADYIHIRKYVDENLIHINIAKIFAKNYHILGRKFTHFSKRGERGGGQRPFFSPGNSSRLKK